MSNNQVRHQLTLQGLQTLEVFMVQGLTTLHSQIWQLFWGGGRKQKLVRIFFLFLVAAGLRETDVQFMNPCIQHQHKSTAIASIATSTASVSASASATFIELPQKLPYLSVVAVAATRRETTSMSFFWSRTRPSLKALMVKKEPSPS